MSTNHSAREVLLPGREYPKPNEEKIAADIVKLLQAEMTRMYPGKEKQLRQIHPKMNGCVKAEFIVEPNLPEKLKVGLFKEPKSYAAWVRFSNGKTKPLPDWKKDIRGFAIKLMNVPGKKMEGDTVHDFILMNTKGFVSGDVGQFGRILKVVTTPTTIANIFPKIFTALTCLPVLGRAKKAAIKMENPAEIPYFSTVPFRFGDETKAVKYALFPSKNNQLVITGSKSKDLIKENLAATLEKHELVFDFCVQFQSHPVKMPIEDPTVIWNSDFEKVATIRIPKQEFDKPEQNKFGDNLSFNSWHCLPEHRPIGNFNRVRKMIYEGMYSFRHKHNEVTDSEPVPGANFFDNGNIQ